jgi:anti-sigma regulatory factor (Ser/Thr protein kinase)
MTPDPQGDTRNPGAAVTTVTTDDTPATTDDTPASTGSATAATDRAGTTAGPATATNPARTGPSTPATAGPAGQAAGPVPRGGPVTAVGVTSEDGRDGLMMDADGQGVVLILQQHLLPAGLPIFPQVRLAARHLVAAQAPGDGCFDAFALAGGTIALMVGRAPGHGPQAVAALSELRSVLRRALHDGAGLADTLNRMDEFAASVPASQGTRVCAALLDPATGVLRYAAAGHPVPLVCTPAGADSGGTVTLLPPSDGKPLGFGTGQPTVATAELAPGAVLLLGGDGAVGDPGRDRTERFAAAAGAALAGSAAAGTARNGSRPDGSREAEPGADLATELADTELADTGLADTGLADTGLADTGLADTGLADTGPPDAADRLGGAVAARLAGGLTDGDVTVLAVHRLAEPGRGLSLRLPAEARALRQLRTRLAQWLAEAGASPLDRVDTELAVYEAAANAIVHGRPALGVGEVAVDVDLDGTGGVLIQVTDQGEWQSRTATAAEDRRGGRGLAVISKVTDELTITPSPEGTTVVMRRALAHPVIVDRAPAP